jgi:transcription-repair coupling factor (superfamily II helicase)
MDRFGDLPQAVSNLLSVARLKIYGMQYGIESVSQKGDDLVFRLSDALKGKVDRKKVDQLCHKMENRFKQSGELESPQTILLRGKGLNMEQKLYLAEKFMKSYDETIVKKEELQNASS